MSFDKGKYGFVFNIQRFSVHDGPGIRTIVFLKGCPLSCMWCSNPESQSANPQLAWRANKCIGCGRCSEVCPQKLITSGSQGELHINRESCQQCFKCASACPTAALHVFGEKMSIEEILSEVESDSAFYARSNGGITLSGGEPLLQADFAINLLKEAKRRWIDTAIETSGYIEWSVLENAGQYLNTVLYDIKCMDSDKHKKYTKVPNRRIIGNFEKLCRKFPQLPVLARTPIIPGFNDTPKDVLSICEFIKQFPNVTYEILPYHRLGQPKYESLGLAYPMGDVQLNDEKIGKFKMIAKECFENG